MTDTIDPVLEAVAVLRAEGIETFMHGNDVERWLIGDLVYDDAGLMRLAQRFGATEMDARYSPGRSHNADRTS